MPVVRTPVKNRPSQAGSVARKREYIWALVILMGGVRFDRHTLPKDALHVVRIISAQFNAGACRGDQGAGTVDALRYIGMPKAAPRLVRAWLDSLSSGVVEFDRNWDSPAPPAIALSGAVEVGSFGRAPDLAAAKTYRYFLRDASTFAFALPLKRGGGVDPLNDKVYVAGPFNGWQAAVGNADWRLRLEELDGEEVLLWTGPADKVLRGGEVLFKFVTGENQWLLPRDDAPNCVRDENGVVNRVIDPNRTGAHLWRFELSASLDLAGAWTLAAGADLSGGQLPLVPGDFFFDLGTDLPLGAIVSGKSTVFRIFAPRADRSEEHT